MTLAAIGRREVATCDEALPVREAAMRMATERIGCLVVLRDGCPVGIVTDRDLVVRAVAPGKDLARTRVGAVMSAPLHTLPQDADRHEAATAMRERQIRRLPVLDAEGALVGMVTIEDLWSDVGRLSANLTEAVSPFPVAHFGG
jgi:CBS domain-containing protein